ncbi:MAG: CRISPR-associated helicase Cas3' [Mollicutes bacterium]|nr:CRISPR-associated helicase Cas3' [Mollicutes bacterium]
MQIKDYLAKPDKTIGQHTEELIISLEIMNKLGYIKDEKIYELSKKACEYHDLGKANKEFQKRVVSNKKLKFNTSKEIFHNILSIYFIEKENFSEEDYLRICHAVLYHHNYCEKPSEYICDNKELIEELLSEFNHFKIKKVALKKINSMTLDNKAIKIKGYLHKCDYSASAGYNVEYKNDFLEEELDNLMNDWKKKNPKSNWNDLQRFCIDNRNENIIAIAETGMGKTEAGLQWIGNNKGFFILPIRTSINAIYDRIKNDIIKNNKLDERIALLHSNSLEYYNKNVNVEDQEEIDIVEYNNRGKQLSMPLSISTLDQLFDFVFKYQGFELKLTTLSYSKIVIDEIQMYGADLLAYLICGLEKIYELGGKIAIVTATLPPFIKYLLRNIPFKYAEFTDNNVRHNIKVIDDSISTNDIMEKYKDNFRNKKANKILVICNTIKKAQEVYSDIKDKLSREEQNNLHLLHSRYIKPERAKKEKEIIEFGKTYNKDDEIDINNGIWVSTSLVEASLDIDFDYLFTELQDINSLFQRFGRCNRKGVKDTEDTNCFVYTKVNSIRRGNSGFIDKTIFDLSKNAIEWLDGKITEQEKLNIINKYFTYENIKNSDYMNEFKEKYDSIKEIPPYEFDKDKVDLRNIMAEDIIPKPVYLAHEDEIDEAERMLNEDKINKLKKLELIELINQYTVSVPYYKNNKKNAEVYKKVKVNKYNEIKIIDCLYDDLGYREAPNGVKSTNFL